MQTPPDKPLPPIVPNVNSVPGDVLSQLHDATEAFDESRQELDATQNSTEFEHQGGIEAATEKVRQAERALEAADQKVKDSLQR